MKTFTVPIPHEERAKILEKLKGKPYVTLHTTNKRGRIAPPEGQGLVYEYLSILDSDDVEFEITANPHNVTNAGLKTRIEFFLEECRRS